MATSGKRAKKTGKGKEHTFLGIPRFILNSPEWGQLNLVCTLNDDNSITLTRKPLPQMTDELKQVIEEGAHS